MCSSLPRAARWEVRPPWRRGAGARLRATDSRDAGLRGLARNFQVDRALTLSVGRRVPSGERAPSSRLGRSFGADAIDCAQQEIDLDRLGQVLGKACRAALGNVGVHPIAGQNDPVDRTDRAKPGEQVMAAAVRKSEVRDQEVEGLVPKGLDGLGQGSRSSGPGGPLRAGFRSTRPPCRHGLRRAGARANAGPAAAGGSPRRGVGRPTVLEGRQLHGERRAFSFAVAFRPDGSPVQVDEGARDREAEPEAARAGTDRSGALLERLEDLGRIPAGIPTPLSETEIRIRPGAGFSLAIRIAPPAGVNLTAFLTRFQNTC